PKSKLASGLRFNVSSVFFNFSTESNLESVILSGLFSYKSCNFIITPPIQGSSCLETPSTTSLKSVYESLSMSRFAKYDKISIQISMASLISVDVRNGSRLPASLSSDPKVQTEIYSGGIKGRPLSQSALSPFGSITSP